ncbi:hypothetical protein [Neisseria chenwenguii]|uniref:hypothetical protein n=1 Tax=Neisseria chenwenguii TaxID=1853278 RepID=UPI000F4E2DFD|nr:hypothetical protein [Neisseria chenwenguii]
MSRSTKPMLSESISNFSDGIFTVSRHSYGYTVLERLTVPTAVKPPVPDEAKTFSADKHG